MDPEHIRELFADFGAVQIRRMFGVGLYAEGVMFALVTGGLIYLKADADSIGQFQADSCGPFEYTTKSGRRAIMSYWRLPDGLYDDPEELARWAHNALAVARKGAQQKAVKARKKKRR